MKKRVKKIFLLLPVLLLSLFFVRNAQVQDWRQLSLQADSLSTAGDIDSAVVTAKLALETMTDEAGIDDTTLIMALEKLGSLTGRQANYVEAEGFYRQGLTKAEQAFGRNHPLVAFFLDKLGWVLMYRGKLADAHLMLDQSLEIRETVFGLNAPEVAKSLNGIGTVCREQGKFADAVQYYERALAINRRINGPEHDDVAANLNNLANAYGDMRRYVEAEQCYKQAIAVYRKIHGPDDVEIAAGLNNLGILYNDQERYTEAEELYRQALAIYERTCGFNDLNVATTLNNLGTLSNDQTKYEEAEPYYLRALTIYENSLGYNHPLVAGALNNLGNLYEQLDRYTEAEQYQKQALTILENVYDPDHPDVASGLSTLAALCREQERCADAEGFEHRAYSICRKNFRDGFEVLSEKNALLFCKTMRDEAASYLSTLLECEAQISQSMDKIANTVFSTKGQISDGIFARFRATTVYADGVVMELADSLNKARTGLAELHTRGPDQKRPERYREALDAAKAEKERLESDIARRSSTYRRELEQWNVEYEKLAERLPEGSYLVEFMKFNYSNSRGRLEAQYLSVLLNNHGDLTIYPLGPAAPIDSAVLWYRAHFQFPPMATLKDYRPLSNEIYRRVWKPFADKLSGASTVFIATDGALNLVSFAGIADEEGNYLIEKYPIHYFSSGRDLLRLDNTSPSGTGLLVLGDPDYDAPAAARGHATSSSVPRTFPPASVSGLRGPVRDVMSNFKVQRLAATRSEVNMISEQWSRSRNNEPVFSFTDEQASEETFKRECRKKRVIHLATHGYYFSTAQMEAICAGAENEGNAGEENPLLFSGLLLAGANLHGADVNKPGEEDGMLSAEEVAGLDLDGTHLVVLSACETGLGELKSGEGAYGLRRAFQMAGARTVISALWQVSDEATAKLMEKLYGSNRTDLAQTMREIALEQIHELRIGGSDDHPKNWAGFIAIGDWRMQ